MKVVSAEQMREIDRLSIEERGIPGGYLMDLAGQAIAQAVLEVPEVESAIVFAGKGNNGGDGFVAARYLYENLHVVLVYTDEPESGDARDAWDRIPVSVKKINFLDLEKPLEFIQQFDVVIDALLGTGIKGLPRAPFDEIIKLINKANVPVISADIPSGLNADTGEGRLAIKAARTVTMGLPKLGMIRAQGPDYTGEVIVAPLKFPTDLLEKVNSPWNTLSVSELAAFLPERPSNGHKGTFGLTLIMAGSDWMPGSALLATEGALRSGTGLVRLHAVNRVIDAATSRYPEILHSPYSPPGGHLLPLNDLEKDHLYERCKAVCFGPGVTEEPDVARLLHQILEKKDTPLVIDADGLNLLAKDSGLQNLIHEKVVLTPHPGEAARLLGNSVDDIQQDRFAALEELSKKFNCTILLKGHGSLVASPDHIYWHLGTGNSALARGGSGDILAGLIAGLMAQGVAPVRATISGAMVHAMAADKLTEKHSARAVRVTEIAEMIPHVFRQIEELKV